MECQTVWIQIGTDILSVPIWVQTVCKGYQQTLKVAATKEKKLGHWFSGISYIIFKPPKWALGAYSFLTVHASLIHVQSISPILFEVGIPNFMCGNTLQSQSVAYCLPVTVTLTSGFNSRKFVFLGAFVTLWHLSCFFSEAPRICTIQKSQIWTSSQQNLSWGFQTEQDSNQSPQLQRLARKLNFHL